jgi:hypothetical protein
MKYLRIFEEFDTWEKITADQWYSTFDMENQPFDETEYETLLDFCFDNANYEKGELCSILFSLGKLHDKKTELEYEGITTSAVGCILSNTGNAMYYDRKYWRVSLITTSHCILWCW